VLRAKGFVRFLNGRHVPLAPMGLTREEQELRGEFASWEILLVKRVKLLGPGIFTSPKLRECGLEERLFPTVSIRVRNVGRFHVRFGSLGIFFSKEVGVSDLIERVGFQLRAAGLHRADLEFLEGFVIPFEL
jgi:hypothetical protein